MKPETMKKNAEKATQTSPWTVQRQGERYVVLDANGFWVADVGEAPDDARHIATSHPQAVIDLVEQLEKITAARDEACRLALSGECFPESVGERIEKLRKGRHMSGKPIKPDEVAEQKTRAIPGPIFDAFNTMIAKHWNGRQSSFKQDDVVAEILRLYPGSERHALFENGYLDVEESYRAEGWHVEYDKPAYCETYPARFTFRKAGSK